jgi:hypothetical protein
LHLSAGVKPLRKVLTLYKTSAFREFCGSHSAGEPQRAVTHDFNICDMKKKNYKHLFNLFVKDVKKINSSSFVNIDSWTLSDDILNGVLIGYAIFDQSDRELLHSIGGKFDLIPLCPDEFVDIEVSDKGKIFGSFVRTMFGKLYISQKSG